MTEYIILDTDVPGPPYHELAHPSLGEEPELAAIAPPGLYVRETKPGKKDPPVLDVLGAIVMKEEIAREAFADIDGVRLEPIEVRRKKDALDGWVHVRVLRFAPLDRARAKVKTLGGRDPFLAVAGNIERIAFDRPPTRIFRILEAPRHIVVDAELGKHLARVTKKLVGPLDDVTNATTFVEGYSKQKPFVVGDPRASADAFVCIARGEKASRTTVLRHPLYALALALDVDREPREDTRAAAAAHPTTAVQYAVMVDRAPHELTRRSADQEVTTAVRYAEHVDRAMSVALMKRMIKSGYWNEEQARALHRDLANPPIAGGQERVATRDLPKPIKAPRFDKKSPIVDPELLSDIDEMLAKGLKLIGASANDPVPDIIDKLHAYADDVRHGEVKATPRLYLALGCVLGEQLHRAFGWSWGTVHGTTPGLFSPSRAHTHMPFMLTQRVAKKGAKANTIALFFNMVADGNLPKAKPGAASLVT